MQDNNLFSINNIYVKYKKNYILKNLSLNIQEGDFFVILGPNGSGKSTLIKSLVRVNKLEAGYILYKNNYINLPLKSTLFFKKIIIKLKLNHAIKKNNEDKIQLYKGMLEQIEFLIKNWNKYKHFHSKRFGTHVSYVPQLSEFPTNTTVYDFVKLGRFPHSNMLGINFDIEKENEIIIKALEDVGIKEYANTQLTELSGGQRQKALIALSLAQETNTIILDEPTNHLDIKSQLEIMELLNHFHKEHNKTIIMIIHDIAMGIKVANNICFIKDGKILTYGNKHEVVNKNIIGECFGIDSKICINGENIEVKDFVLKNN